MAQKLFFILICLLPQMVFAAPTPEQKQAALEAQPKCQNFVRFDDDNLYLGFGPYMQSPKWPRQEIPATVEVASILNPSQKTTLETLDSAVDAVSYQGKLFVLTYSAIEEWDLATKQRVATYRTYFINRDMEYREHPTGMELYHGPNSDQLVISHGRLGFSTFDLKTRHLLNQKVLVKEQYPHESQSRAVSILGNKAYFLMDNFTLAKPGQPQALRGIVVYDLDSQQIVKNLDGLDPMAEALIVEKNKMIVSYGVFLWRFSTDILNGNRLYPDTNAIKFDLEKGHPVGKPSVDDKNFYTCYLQKPEKPGGVYKQVPKVFTRESLQIAK